MQTKHGVSPIARLIHIFVIGNRYASEERALSDKCGSYLTAHVVILGSCS